METFLTGQRDLTGQLLPESSPQITDVICPPLVVLFVCLWGVCSVLVESGAGGGGADIPGRCSEWSEPRELVLARSDGVCRHLSALFSALWFLLAEIPRPFCTVGLSV